MKSLLYFTLLLLFSSTTLLGQRTITGTVTGDTGDPLIGATVVAKGTTIGTVTEVDGTYSLNVPDTTRVLVFSYTGYQTEEVALGASNTVDIALNPGVRLEEIVVTGQGIGIERKRLTSTVDVLNAEQIEAAPVTQLDQILQSRLPGAQIRLSSGQPGTASIIRNRGPISANSSATPVIIVDGVRVDNLNSNPALGLDTGGASSSAIADIPVESIERVEFIRGGAATTLYGADAANGVLQIFTKKGTKGTARFNFESQLGAMQGETKFLRFDRTADLIYNPGFVQSYRAGVDGGGDNVTYNFSGNYYDDNGFNNVNQQRRVGLRSSISANIGQHLQYIGSAAFASNYFTRDYNANTSFARFGNIEGGAYGNVDELSSGAYDTLKQQLTLQGQLTDVTEAVRRFQTSHTFQYNPFNGLDAKITVGLDNRESEQRDLESNALLISKDAVAPGTDDQGNLNVATRNFLSITTDLNIQYRFDVGNFSFITGTGGQLIRQQDKQYQTVATNLTEGSETVNNAAETQTQDYLREIAFGGFYFSENIGFQNKLFLDAAARFDGNSAFGKDIGLVDIYRVGLTYSLTDEPFFTETSLGNIFTQIKFRANFGQATNFPTPFARDRVFAVNPFLGIPTFTFGNPGNQELRPETVNSYEAGLDLAMLNSRLRFRFTYYDNTTVDAIFTPPSIPSSGQLAQETNVGEISNKGIELEGIFRILDMQNLSLDFNASLTTNKNLVVSSGGAPEFVVGGFTFLGSFVKEGEPLGYFRGGKPIFDAEGNLVEVERNAFLGDPNPDGYGTLGLTLNWQRLSFYTTADYQYGAQGVAVDDVLRYFNGVNDPGRIPENAASASFFDLAGVWVENTDFLKIRNIGFFYNIPVENTVFKRLELGINLRNPFAFASSSFDPEVTGAGIGAQNGFSAGGFGFGTESQPKQYLFTIRAGF